MDDIIKICMYCGHNLKEFNPDGFIKWIDLDENAYCLTNVTGNPVWQHEPIERWMIKLAEAVLFLSKIVQQIKD